MSAKKECSNCEFFIDKKCAISQSKYYEIDYEKNEKIEIIINNFDIFNDTKTSFDIKEKKFSLNITLGDSYTCQNCKFKFDCKSGNCIFSVLCKGKFYSQFKGNSKLKNIIINVGANFLKNHAGSKILKKILNSKNSKLISEAKCLPDTIFLAKEIFFSKEPSPLFLKSKIFGILDNELKNLENSKIINISKIEREMLENAYKIIEKNYANPLSIKELSYKVGLNESKLKTLFKAFFGSTIHEASTKLRMQKAKELISDGQNLKSVAYKLGFSALSNFSSAFKKHFGFTPSKFKD